MSAGQESKHTEHFCKCLAKKPVAAGVFWIQCDVAMLNQPVNSYCRRSVPRRLVAGSLLGLFLTVMAVAHSHALHHAVCPHAQQAGHECAATMLAHGLIDAATPEICLPSVTLRMVALRPTGLPHFLAADHRFPPGRAPPGPAA